MTEREDAGDCTCQMNCSVRRRLGSHSPDMISIEHTWVVIKGRPTLSEAPVRSVICGTGSKYKVGNHLPLTDDLRGIQNRSMAQQGSVGINVD